MTVYAIGYVVAFLMILSILSSQLSREEEYELDIVAYMSGLLLLSLFSWAMVLAITIMFIFEFVKNKKEKQ